VTSALDQFVSAALVLEHETAALELAVRAMFEACPRGLAIGFLSRGPRSESLGAFRLFHEGRFSRQAMPLLAHVRTPAYDVANVPSAQRNRWVEPFREGIATHEGFKASTLYPFVARFGVLEQGRVAVCAGERQVALVGLAIPEGTEFSDEERSRLTATGEALVVPLRIAALVSDELRERSALERILESTQDALVATNARGQPVLTSRAAVVALRRDRKLAGLIEAAARVANGGVARHREGGVTIHVSPHREGDVAYLVALDTETLVEPPLELSERQRELIGLVERGLSNAEIGSAMSLAPSTVKTMLERLYKKAQVAGRAELAHWARERGVIDPRSR